MADKPVPIGARREARPLHAPAPDNSYNHPQTHAHAQADWEWLLDNGLITNRNPAPTPDVVAAREASQRLFRAIARSRCGIW